MFMQTKRRGLFGAPTTFPGTPGIGDEIDPNNMPAPRYGMPGMGLPAEAQQPRKMGLGSRLFGQGWEDKAFALGGILQGDGGAAWRDTQERKMRPLLEQAQRDAEWADWQRKKQWERDNPAPVNNDTVADYEFIRQRLGDEAASEFLKNKANPPVYRQGADGAFYRVDTPQVPTAPVGKLTPITEGGPQVPPAATFPRR